MLDAEAQWPVGRDDFNGMAAAPEFMGNLERERFYHHLRPCLDEIIESEKTTREIDYNRV